MCECVCIMKRMRKEGRPKSDCGSIAERDACEDVNRREKHGKSKEKKEKRKKKQERSH